MKSDLQADSSKTTKITIGTILAWVLGGLFTLIGIVGIFSDPLPGFFALLLGALFLPPVNALAAKKLHFVLSRPLKILVAICLLALIGATAPDTTPANSSQKKAQIAADTPAREQQATMAWQTVQSFSGKGNQDTASFTVSGDQVRLTATTRGGTAGIGTFSGISLESEGGAFLGAGLSISTEGAEEGHGETIYRRLKPGQYYVSVISGVSWEVKVEEYR